MAPVGSERKVLMVVQDMKQATKGQISKCLGLTSDYVEYLCRYLVLGGYLKETKGAYVGRKYSLTPDGQKALGGYAGAVGAQTPFAPGAGYHKVAQG